MGRSGGSTVPADRSITDREAAVVDWVLANGAMDGPLEHLREEVPRLRVVGRCGCGCASIDFVAEGQSPPARPIADAVGRDSHGRQCGLIVWGRDGIVTGLEVYEMESNSSTEIPRIETLRPWASA